MEQIQQTVLEQINARYLKAIGFILVGIEGRDVKLIFKGKAMVISLNKGKDVYEVQKYSHKSLNAEIEKKHELYCYQLADEIEQHFKIAYGGFKPQFG